MVFTLAILFGCGGGRASKGEVPPIVPAGASAELEPRLAGASCSIAGSTPSLAEPALPLCGKRGRACFGSLRANDTRGVQVTSLHLDDAGAGEVDLARGGLTVHGVVEAAGFLLHAAAAEPVDRYFVPTNAAMRVEHVANGSISVAIDPGNSFVPAAPLRATWSCSKVSLDPLALALGDVLEALALHDGTADVAPISGAVQLRGEPSGAIVATVSGDVVARVVDQRAGKLRVVIEVDAGFLVGWVDAASYRPAGLRGRRVHTPRIYEWTTHDGATCPHPVRVVARVDGEVVHVATIDAGERFDPSAPRARIEEILDLASPPPPVWIPSEQLAGCAAPR